MFNPILTQPYFNPSLIIGLGLVLGLAQLTFMQCNNVLYIKFNQILHVFKNSKYVYINEKVSFIHFCPQIQSMKLEKPKFTCFYS